MKPAPRPKPTDEASRRRRRLDRIGLLALFWAAAFAIAAIGLTMLIG